MYVANKKIFDSQWKIKITFLIDVSIKILLNAISTVFWHIKYFRNHPLQILLKLNFT